MVSLTAALVNSKLITQEFTTETYDNIELCQWISIVDSRHVMTLQNRVWPKILMHLPKDVDVVCSRGKVHIIDISYLWGMTFQRIKAIEGS